MATSSSRRRARAARPPGSAGGPGGFRSAVGGNVAITFALASVPLLLFSGAAIDYGLATRQQTRLQAASDATVLNLCQTPPTTTVAQLQAQAVALMAGYVPDPSLAIDPLAVTAGTQTTARTITLTAHVNSTAFFGGVTGATKLPVKGASQCATPVAKTFEIALVLDNTGSMTESSGTQTKIQAVQQAATNFVNYVKNNGAFSTASRIAVVPFAAAVAVDPVASGSATATWVDTKGLSAYHWTNVDAITARGMGYLSRLSIFDALNRAHSGWGWAGCFETPPYPQNVQDGAPSTAQTLAGWNSLYVPLFAPDEPGGGSTGYACWSANGSTSCSGNPAAYTFNSYIDDTGSGIGCINNSTNFLTAEKQACKYGTHNTLQATVSNPYTGLPNGPNFECVSKPLQRLTTDANVLKTLIASLTAAGSTNIHDGIMWGWRTLSPISVFADGAPYNSTTTTKVLILMTDGTNTWPGNPYNSYNGGGQYFTLGYLKNADGSTPGPRLPANFQDVSTSTGQRNALDELTLEACTNAKAAGISVYTIGFSVPQDPIDNQGLQLLQNCATNSGQAFVANTSDDLIAAFNKIAASIGALRVTQ